MMAPPVPPPRLAPPKIRAGYQPIAPGPPLRRPAWRQGRLRRRLPFRLLGHVRTLAGLADHQPLCLELDHRELDHGAAHAVDLAELLRGGQLVAGAQRARLDLRAD